MRLTGPMTRSLALGASCVAAILGACAQHQADPSPPTTEPATTTASVALGDTLRVMRGQSGTVDGGRLTIRFDSTSEDSRCRAGVQCVWAGDIAAILAVTAGASTARLTLHTGLEPRRASVGAYAIELVTVTPYPGTEPPNARLAQVAVLRVTRP
jgi:hypothetical protein